MKHNVCKKSSPCKVCIVRATCGEACENAMNHLSKLIIDFKPEGSSVPVFEFLKNIVEDILHSPNENIPVTLYYDTNRRNSRVCMLFVKDSSIYEILEDDNEYYKSV